MMWLKNVWYVAGFEHELEAPFIARTFLDQAVVILRGGGKVVAMEDACPHRLVPLSKGKRVGESLQCGYHGMRFGLDGRCVEIPGQQTIPARAGVRVFPMAVRHGLLWIWLGDPECADQALVPDLHWHGEPDWVSSSGYHKIACDYRLMNDNLLDLSHETYVHTRTIGNEEEETIANFPMTVTVEHDTLVRAHREMPNIEAPPFFAMVLKYQGLIHRWQTAIHHVPGINMTDVGVYPIDQAREQAHVMHVLHLVTPETAGTCHYFWALVRNFDRDDAQLTETIRQGLSATFDEDKEMLEIQQRQIDKLGGPIPRVAIRLDEAAVRARRLLAQRIDQEQADQQACQIPVALLEEA